VCKLAAIVRLKMARGQPRSRTATHHARIATMSVFSAAALVADTVQATFAAVWPRSAARHEIDRLREEGHLAGEACEMAFSLSFDDAQRATDASALVRRAGFALDLAEAKSGFLTARMQVRLTPWELARAVARLERVARSRGGFVAVVGPTHAPAAAPVRAPSRSRTGEMVAAL
jgi:hypothetical protein